MVPLITVCPSRFLLSWPSTVKKRFGFFFSVCSRLSFVCSYLSFSFAAAFLFPEPCARLAYQKINASTPAIQMNWIKTAALRFIISPITVLNEINKYAVHNNLSPITTLNKSIYGAAINVEKTFPTVSEHLFDGKAPKAAEFITKSEKAFGTQFFSTMDKFLAETGEGPSYVQRVMNIPLVDAIEIYQSLRLSDQPNVNEVV